MSDGRRAVIFDMDGVLVDSYRAHFESWQQLAAECGAEFNEEQFAITFGRTSRDILRTFFSDGRELSDRRVADMDDRKEGLYRQIIARNFPAMDGARELVAALHEAGFALAIGSSGPPENVRVSLTGLGMAECFGATVSGADVIHGKPHPDIFFKAAEKLGVQPARCAVIEDAPAGVEAARRAGMTPVALTGTVRRDALAAATIVVDSLRELTPRHIARLIDAGGR